MILLQDMDKLVCYNLTCDRETACYYWKMKSKIKESLWGGGWREFK